MNELHTRCPSCGYRHELASKVGGDGPGAPDAGSISLCIACGEVAVFEDDFVGLRLRTPTEAERVAIDADETVEKLREAWSSMRIRHPHAWPGQP